MGSGDLSARWVPDACVPILGSPDMRASHAKAERAVASSYTSAVHCELSSCSYALATRCQSSFSCLCTGKCPGALHTYTVQGIVCGARPRIGSDTNRALAMFA